MSKVTEQKIQQLERDCIKCVANGNYALLAYDMNLLKDALFKIHREKWREHIPQFFKEIEAGAKQRVDGW